MKKTLLIICLTFLPALMMYGQATEGTVRLQRTDAPAATIQLPYPPDIVKAALKDYLSQKGKSKGTDIKGFITFRNTQPASMGNDNADLYFKIERKSRQEKEMTVVSLLLTRPTEENAASSQMNYLSMDLAKDYLNDLVPAIEAYNLELQIKEQNQVVIKSESLYKTQFDNGAGLEKKRAELETEMAENTTEQQRLLTDVNIQKQKLTDLVNQRKQ